LSDYFIPVPTLLKSVVGIPIEKLPVIGILYKEFGPHIGLRDLRASWNDTHTTISGEAVINTEVELGFSGFKLIAGNADGEQTVFRFEMSSSRESLLDFFGPDAAGADPALVAFLQTDAFAKKSRIVIPDLGFKLRLPREHAKLGERIIEGGNVIGVRALTPEKPVDIVLPQATLVIDSDRGISITLDEDQALECPPFLLGDSGIGFEVRNLKVDLSTDSGIPEVISRPGFDESWRGIYMGELDVYNLNSLLSFLPRKIAATNWIIGGEGWSGAIDLIFPEGDPEDVWHVGRLGIEFDRGSLVRGTISAVFRAGKISNEFVTLGPDGNLEILFTLRHNPAVPGAAAWGFEIGLLTPGTGDTGLLTLSENFLDATSVVVPNVVLIALAMDDEVSAGDILVFALLNALVVLQATDTIVIRRLTLDALRFRYYTRQIGDDVVRLIDVVLDLQVRLAIDINLGLVLTAKTERPIAVDFKGLTLTWVITDWDGLAESTRTTLGGRFQFSWEVMGGVTFDLSEQSLLRESILEFVKFGVGKWERGLWFDIGVRSTANLSEAFMGGGEVRLFYLSDGAFDHLELKGIAITILVPEVIYCRAELGWGDVKLISTKAMLIGNGKASLQPVNPADPMGKLRRYMKREVWNFDAEVLMRFETLPTGEDSIVVGIDIGFSSGIPLGTSGVSLFGLLGQYAQNARPNVVGDDYLTWFRELPTVNSVLGPNKWIGDAGSWGFSIGTVLGSAPDLGNTWNAKVGLTLLIPGPVIILFGAATLLEKKPGLKSPDESKFIALIVLDFEENVFTLAIIVEYFVPSPDGSLLAINIPGEIFVDLEEASQTHVYLGEHLPLSRRVKVRSLGLFDVSGYLMLDGQTITNLAGKGINVPAFAIAVGGRAEFIHGLKSGRLRCYFSLGVEFHLAVGLPDPWLFFGMLRLDGSLVVKVFGFGFDLTVWAELTAIAPEPFVVKGEIGISIDLPWPIPNINCSLPLTFADSGGDIPPPGGIGTGLTFIPRNENQPVELSSSALTEGVAVDPTFSLSFRFPIRNSAGTVGSFNCDETNSTTRFMTGDGHGFIFELEDLRLTNLDSGIVKTGLPAVWRKELAKAPRGEEARMVIDLMSYDSIISSRFVGASATYVNGATAEWNPCRPPVQNPKKVCYGLEGQPPGIIGDALLTLNAPPRPSVRVFNDPPPDNAETLMSTFGFSVRRSEVVTIQLAAPTPAVIVPTTYDVQVEGPFISETLVFEFERAVNLVLTCVRRSQAGPFGIATFFDGANVVGTSFGQTVGFAHDFEFIDFPSPATATRAEIRAWQGGERLHQQMFLVRLCMHYESELVTSAENEASMTAWSNFWSALLAQDAAAGDALLLDANSRYRLQGRVRWSRVENPGSGGLETFSFDFRTQSRAREIKPLKKRDPQLPINDDRWEIDTLPGDGTFAMYLERPIRLTFSSPRIEAVFAKFDEKLVLRLIDDKGQDLFDTLEFLREHATELPEYQQVWQQQVLEASCTPDGASSLWDLGVAIFDSILQPNRDYTASLHVVPVAVTDFAGAEWSAFPIVHGFKFRTSRWSDLHEHLTAHITVDEIAGPQLDLAQIAVAAGAVVGRIDNDQLLERVLYELISLPVRSPARDPEVIIVWREIGGVYSAIGLLLDGPEPLQREPGSTVTLRRADTTAIEFLNLTGQSRTRSLLLFSRNNAFAPVTEETITLVVNDAFTNSSGVAVVETASLVIPIPVTPSIFAEEAAP
jgi:hypothetical protein